MSTNLSRHSHTYDLDLGDSLEKFHVIFFPEGYSTREDFEADVSKVIEKVFDHPIIKLSHEHPNRILEIEYLLHTKAIPVDLNNPNSNVNPEVYGPHIVSF